MIRATEVRGQYRWIESPADTVVLDFDDRHRRRMAMTGTRGLEFLLDLENAVALRGGDALVLEDGRLIEVVAAPEPLLGPPEGHKWGIHWSSENPDYQGVGISPLSREDGAWQIPGQTAIVLTPSGIARV